MKGLNKLIQVTAIVAASGANAELKAIDDAAMGEVTGQSGIVIEAGFGTLGGADALGLDAGGSAGQFSSTGHKLVSLLKPSSGSLTLKVAGTL